MATSPLTSNHAFSHASDIFDTIFNWPLDETDEAIRVAPDLETSRLFISVATFNFYVFLVQLWVIVWANILC